MVKFDGFTVINVKMYSVFVDYSGIVVFKNHMYAVIHYVMTEVMTLSDESSKFIDVISNFHRLEHISCLGSACKLRTFLEFPFHQIRQYDAIDTTASNTTKRQRYYDIVVFDDVVLSNSTTMSYCRIRKLFWKHWCSNL